MLRSVFFPLLVCLFVLFDCFAFAFACAFALRVNPTKQSIKRRRGKARYLSTFGGKHSLILDSTPPRYARHTLRGKTHSAYPLAPCLAALDDSRALQTMVPSETCTDSGEGEKERRREGEKEWKVQTPDTTLFRHTVQGETGSRKHQECLKKEAKAQRTSKGSKNKKKKGGGVQNRTISKTNK